VCLEWPLHWIKHFNSESTNIHGTSYLWSKVVCLFCFVLFLTMRSAKPGCLESHSWSLWKALKEEGCISMVPWPLDLWCRSFWILKEVFSLEIKWNPNWTFHRNWEVLWVLFEGYWWLGFNKIYFIRFGLRTWEILSFRWFLSLKFK
jgi:hypothetical protein